MPRRTAIISVHQLKEINMIPLIDVMMFLLVVFIITVPLIEQGIPVNLPRGASDALDAQHIRAITIDHTGRIFLDQSPITKEALAQEMGVMGRADPQLTVSVRGDEAVPYGRVAEVLQLLKDAHIPRVAFVTSPEVKAAP